MRVAQQTTRRLRTGRKLRLGGVSFLNAKPLIYGLEETPGVELALEIPSRLLDGLRGGRYDVALLPVIDYQRMAGLRLLTSGGIGCDGPTLTVRIFSPVPIHEIRILACDTDSHTSIALARVLLTECYGVSPKFVPLDRARSIDQRTAQLLIGDKVVCQEPRDLPHQLDLGEAWKRLTGLPFVFAAWMTREGVDLADLPAELAEAKRRGLAHVDEIVSRDAIPRGWAPDTARRYLTEYLKFDIGAAHLKAIERFHALAAAHNLLDLPPRPLLLYDRIE